MLITSDTDAAGCSRPSRHLLQARGRLAMFRVHNLLARSRLHGLAVAVGLLATTYSTLSVYPHSIAYFNEASGGPENGHKHLLHSNLDWGQDLLIVRNWMRQAGIPSEVVRFDSYYPYPAGELISQTDSAPAWDIVSPNKVFQPLSSYQHSFSNGGVRRIEYVMWAFPTNGDGS
jgi:hypothetical protein